MIDALRPLEVAAAVTCAHCSKNLEPGARAWRGGRLDDSGVSVGLYCLVCVRAYVRGEPGGTALEKTRQARKKKPSSAWSDGNVEPDPKARSMQRAGWIGLGAAFVFLVADGIGGVSDFTGALVTGIAGGLLLILGLALQLLINIDNGHIELPRRVQRLLFGHASGHEDARNTSGVWVRLARGQKVAAASLDRVAAGRSLHDRQMPKAVPTLDHLVVGPAGVYVVCSRAFSGALHITRFRKMLAGVYDETDALLLARHQARVVAKKVHALTGTRVPVFAVVCLTGDAQSRELRQVRGVTLTTQFNVGRFLSRPGSLVSAQQESLTDLLAWSFPHC